MNERQLTDQQLLHFDSDGYIILRNLLDDEGKF